MSLEEFWMEIGMATVIAAVFGILGVLIGNIFSMNTFKTKVESEHNALATEHSNNREFEKSEHNNLSEQHKTIIEQYNSISEDLKFLRDAENKNIGRMESMSKPEVDTVSVVNTLNDMLDFSKKQGEELKKYIKLANNLQIENAKLKSENLKLRRSLEIEEEAEV